MRDHLGNYTRANLARLSLEEVERACPKFKEVQRLIDSEYSRLRLNRPELTGGRLGTALHLAIKNAIDEKKDGNLKAEVSYLNGKEETPAERFYGKKGSIRPDIRELPEGEQPAHLVDLLSRQSAASIMEVMEGNNLCYYEVTIGKAPVKPLRMEAVASHTATAFPDRVFNSIIVMEARPRNARDVPFKAPP